MIWNKTEIKKFIERSKKDWLIIDLENGFLSNGVAIFKIDREMKQILEDMFITQSFYFTKFQYSKDKVNLKSICENALKECVSQELKLTPFLYQTKSMQSKFFISENEKNTMLINPLFLKPFNENLILNSFKFYCSDSQNCTANFMIVKHSGEPVAFILPQRNDLKYKVVKNFESEGK